MKIEKEIIFAAKIDEVRELLDKSGIRNHRSFYEIEGIPRSSGGASGNKRASSTSRKDNNPEGLSGGITTEFDLAEFGSRTLLKITVNGWDKLNPEKAKLEMPRAALLLERKLSQMKKALEKQART
jgi:hypothetical protein